MQLLYNALPIPTVWARELIRHSNRQPVQSRDTAATFLEVCMARWVGALGITIWELKDHLNYYKDILKEY